MKVPRRVIKPDIKKPLSDAVSAKSTSSTTHVTQTNRTHATDRFSALPRPVAPTGTLPGKTGLLRDVSNGSHQTASSSSLSSSTTSESSAKRRPFGLRLPTAGGLVEQGRGLLERGQEAGKELLDEATTWGGEAIRDVLGEQFDGGVFDNATTVYDPSHSFVGNGPTENPRLQADDVPDMNRDGVHTTQDVERLVATNEAEIDRQVAQWPSEAQGQYQDIAMTLVDDPRAQLALQQLVLQDQLPGAAESTDGDTLLGELNQLATQPLADGIDRGEYVGDVIQEIQDPVMIYQGAANLCGPTAASQVLATENPAEYARLAGGLATPEGTITMANGDTLVRDEGVIGEATSDRNRSLSTALMGASLLEYGNGRLNYDPATDKTAGVVDGTFQWQENKILEAITGRDYQVQHALTSGQQATLMEDIKAKTDLGEMVPTSIRYSDNGMGLHYVSVVDVTDTTVTIVNPHGKKQEIPIDEFQQNLLVSHLPPS